MSGFVLGELAGHVVEFAAGGEAGESGFFFGVFFALEGGLLGSGCWIGDEGALAPSFAVVYVGLGKGGGYGGNRAFEEPFGVFFLAKEGRITGEGL